jgi:hypothetical protein
VEEVLAVMKTPADAASFFQAVRAELATCPPARLSNDSGTGLAPPLSVGVGDESVYVAEHERNIVSQIEPSTESWLMVRRGPIVFRMFIQFGDRASRSRSVPLARTLVARIDAAH